MGQCNIFFRELFALFLKTVHKNNDHITVKKSKQSKGITSEINSCFPKVFGISKFLKVSGWYSIQFFYQIEYPNYLLSLFAFERV